MSVFTMPPGFLAGRNKRLWYSGMRGSLKDIDSGFLTDAVSVNPKAPNNLLGQFGEKGSSAYIAATKMVIPPATAGFDAIKAQFQDVSAGLPANIGSGPLLQVAASSLALVSGGIDLSSVAGGSAALNIAKEAFATVPVLGTAAAALVGVYDTVMGAQAEAYAKLAAKATAAQENWKRKVCYLSQEYRLENTLDLETGKSFPAPSNLFLYNAYDAFKRESYAPFLPPVMGSIYVMLCGGETQGYGFTRPQYAEFLKYHKGRNIPGIAPPVQRKMWRLIQSIMDQVLPPFQEASLVAPDSGRCLVPLLNNIVLQQWMAGNIDELFIKALSHTLAAENQKSSDHYAAAPWYAAASKYVVRDEVDCAGGSYVNGGYLDDSHKRNDGCKPGYNYADTPKLAREGKCTKGRLTFDLTDAFAKGVLKLRTRQSVWLDEATGVYNLYAKPSPWKYVRTDVSKMGMLTLKQSAIDRLASDTEGAFSGISKMPEWKKGLFATSLLFGTYGLYRAGDYALERWMPSKKA